MNIIQAKQNDPREYGRLLAKASHSTDNFQSTVRGLNDLVRAELMMEGWNEYQEETGHDDRLVTLVDPPGKPTTPSHITPERSASLAQLVQADSTLHSATAVNPLNIQDNPFREDDHRDRTIACSDGGTVVLTRVGHEQWVIASNEHPERPVRSILDWFGGLGCGEETRLGFADGTPTVFMGQPTLQDGADPLDPSDLRDRLLVDSSGASIKLMADAHGQWFAKDDFSGQHSPSRGLAEWRGRGWVIVFETTTEAGK